MMNRVVKGLAVVAAVLGVASGVRGGDLGCEPGWVEGQFRPIGMNGQINTMIVFDDGTGPVVYAGGWFTTAHGESANYIARWSGSEWEPVLDSQGLGIERPPGAENYWVGAMAVYDDGSGPAMYIGGRFIVAGGQEVNHIVKWDGTEWSALGGDPQAGVQGGWVSALAVYDDGNGPALYVGGSFSTAGSEQRRLIAKWDGNAWSSVHDQAGAGLDGAGAVESMLVFDSGTESSLYVGGYFPIAGNQTVNGIARWDGEMWHALAGPNGIGVSATSSIEALARFDDGSGPALYAAGSFLYAGGVLVERIAKWDGNEWSALTGKNGTGLNIGGAYATGLEVFDSGDGPKLHVVGGFGRAGGYTARGLATWDGQDWSIPSDSNSLGYARHTALHKIDMGYGEELYTAAVIGSDLPKPIDYQVLSWQDDALSVEFTPPNASVENSIHTIAEYDDGTGNVLYMGGEFHFVGNDRVNLIAKWDGHAWSALTSPDGTGLHEDSSVVSVLHSFNDGQTDSLYVGGSFKTWGEEPVHSIARWDGSAWHALTGPEGDQIEGPTGVTSIMDYDDGNGPAIYVAGYFNWIGDLEVRRLARWDGTTWSALSGPLGTGIWPPTARVSAMTVFDDGTGPALYVGGNFSHAGGVLANGIAKWDGSEWSSLTGPSGNGVNGEVYALAAYDDGSGPALYVGGSLSLPGGVAASNIARWDGEAWSAVSSSGSTGTARPVRTLHVFDDGSGEALYVGGDFINGGNLTANGIVRWDGSEWSTLDGGVGTGETTPQNSFHFPTVRTMTRFEHGNHSSLFVGGGFAQAGETPSSFVAEWRGCAEQGCPADITGDGVIDLADLNLVLANFGQAPDAGDATGDGKVNKDDLNAVLAAFGTSCE